MSILIKGVKMPKEGNYEARLNVNRDGTALLFLYGECGGHEAKEIPPHGDLIDAEEEIRLMQSSEYDTYNDYCRAFDMLANAPTIIDRDNNVPCKEEVKE